MGGRKVLKRMHDEGLDECASPTNRRAVLEAQIEFHEQQIAELQTLLSKLKPPKPRRLWLTTPLAEVFDDDVRLVNALESIGALVLSDLLNLRREELMAVPNFGTKMMETVFGRLRELGFNVAETYKEAGDGEDCKTAGG